MSVFDMAQHVRQRQHNADLDKKREMALSPNPSQYGGSPQGYFQQFAQGSQATQENPEYWRGGYGGETQRQIPPWMWASGETVGLQGASHLAGMMQDPYNLPEDMLRDEMGGTENAYQVARQRVGNDTLSSGAGGGGVARGARGNMELARGAGMSDSLRKYNQYRTATGDERLRSLWMPYQRMFMPGAQQQPDPGPSGFQQALQVAGTVGGIAMMCWVAREIYGADDPRWLKARHYVLRIAPREFRDWYRDNGERVAQRVKANPALRKGLRPLFDHFVAEAEADLAKAT